MSVLSVCHSLPPPTVFHQTNACPRTASTPYTGRGHPEYGGRARDQHCSPSVWCPHPRDCRAAQRGPRSQHATAAAGSLCGARGARGDLGGVMPGVDVHGEVRGHEQPEVDARVQVENPAPVCIQDVFSASQRRAPALVQVQTLTPIPPPRNPSTWCVRTRVRVCGWLAGGRRRRRARRMGKAYAERRELALLRLRTISTLLHVVLH